MATKAQLIQLVKNAIGDQNRDRLVAFHLGMVFEQLLGQVYGRDPEQLNYYCQDFDCHIYQKGTMNYVLFPKKVIHFSDLKKGCRAISYTDDSSLRFVPVSLLGRRIYPSINTGDKSIGFEVKTDRAIFDNLPAAIKEVTLSLVIAFNQYANDDEIPLPSGISETLIQMAVASMKNEQVPINIHKTPKQTV